MQILVALVVGGFVASWLANGGFGSVGGNNAALPDEEAREQERKARLARFGTLEAREQERKERLARFEGGGASGAPPAAGGAYAQAMASSLLAPS